MKVLNVKLSSIKNATENYRTKESEKDVASLMQSIKDTGLLNPITVKKVKGGYKLLAGFRRFRAFKNLKKETIPVNVVANSVKSNVVNLVENIQRESTSSYEIGRGIYLAMNEDDLTVNEVGVMLGMSKATINLYLGLFKGIPSKYRDKVIGSKKSGLRKQGTISNTAAYAILNLKKDSVITAKEKNELFDMAAKDRTLTASKIKSMAKTNININKIADEIRSITVKINLSNSDYKKIGKSPAYKIRKMVENNFKVSLL